jgi:hypothetical protein
MYSCCTLLRESTKEPTQYRQLIPGWPDFIGFIDASVKEQEGLSSANSHRATTQFFSGSGPMMWQKTSTLQIIERAHYKLRSIRNSDLEMAGLVLLWQTMEEVCRPFEEKRQPFSTTTSRQLVG